MALEAIRGNMHMDIIALVDAGIIGPLPSCFGPLKSAVLSSDPFREGQAALY